MEVREIITLHSSKETNFNNNGLCVLDNAISCIVSEEANSIFSLELEYPIIKGDKKREHLKEGNIIKASTPKLSNQLFRISNKRILGDTIVVYAMHIFYDLLGCFIEDTRPTLQSGVLALPYILQGTVDPHRFTGQSNISNISTANYIRKNVVESLIGDLDQSFLSRWGGEVERDNFNIKIDATIGQDRGYTIKYGKNLEGIEETIDMSGIITKIMATGLNANDTTLMLPEKYILSKYINNYPNPRTTEFHYTELKVNEENGITKELIYADLREKVKELYDVQKIDLPKFNYKVNFIDLSKTEEYKDYKVLNQVYLYDTVTINNINLGLDFKGKVISYKWDSILDKYLEIELGDFKDNLSTNFTKIQAVLHDISEVIKQDKTDLELAIDHATNLMNNALGGYVVKRNGEILIMDTEDPNTCLKCWKWNINGLGYSSTGYNGRYELAMTMDGRINANFVTTGVLNANLVQTGALRSKDGSVNINLDNGSFRIGGNGAVAEHTPKGSKYLHFNGGYTQVTARGLQIVTSGGRTAFKVDDSGYIYNEYGVSSRVAPGEKLTLSNGVTLADDKCSTLLRAFGIWHESVDDKYNMRIASKNEIWFKNLADEWQTTRSLWSYAQQFRVDNGCVLRENSLDTLAPSKRLWLNNGGGAPNQPTITLVGDGMGSLGELACQKLTVNGQKNRIVQTENYGVRALNAVESADCFFIDKDIAETVNGTCKVYIKPIFKETISTSNYFVDFTKYGEGDMWVEEITKDYFVMKSKRDIKFVWTITAKQKGYENERLTFIRDDIEII